LLVDVRQQILWRSGSARAGVRRARSAGLLDVAARGALSGWCWRIAEFDSEANHEHIRQRLGAKKHYPRQAAGCSMVAIRNQMFRAFPKKPYQATQQIEKHRSPPSNASSLIARPTSAALTNPDPAQPSCSAWPPTEHFTRAWGIG